MPHADTLTVVHHDDTRTRFKDVRYELHRDGIRIWSAGCATGAQPASPAVAAMVSDKAIRDNLDMVLDTPQTDTATIGRSKFQPNGARLQRRDARARQQRRRL